MGKVYTFEPGANPCDTCDAMAGDYDYRPVVPVHPNCVCQVKERDEGDDDCEYEVRNLEVYVDTYTETTEMDYQNPGDTEAPITIQAELGILESAFDEGVEAALDWEPTWGGDSCSVTVPARSSGDVVLEVEYTQMVCSGELWRVCSRPDPIAGVQTEERLVGHVGGAIYARTALVDCSVDDTPDNAAGSDGGYHDEDDEVPV